MHTKSQPTLPFHLGTNWYLTVGQKHLQPTVSNIVSYQNTAERVCACQLGSVDVHIAESSDSSFS